MHLTRRTTIKLGMAGIAATTIMPYAALAQGGGSDTYETDNGKLAIHPIQHASFVMETPSMVIYADPVGGADAYSGQPDPDLILITHEHGDHFNVETLQGIVTDQTKLLTNPAVFDKLPDELKAMASSIGNGEETTIGDIKIEAIPAYNITEERKNFHPEGRDNGYVLTIDGKRVYISGDTEGTPEMRALENIDVAFVSMNLPFTMAAKQAADAVAEFKPAYVYPYHYRGRDGGTQDPEEFAKLLAEAQGSDGKTEVKMGPWYS